MELIFFSVRVVENVGKIEIVLKKKENIPWKSLGRPLENHNSLIPKKDTGMLCCYFEFCVYEIVVLVLLQSVEGHFRVSQRFLVFPNTKLKWDIVLSFLLFFFLTEIKFTFYYLMFRHSKVIK